MSIVVALIILAAAVGAIYLLLRNMGEEGVEIAAPGSCKRGRCGVRCSPEDEASASQTEAPPDEVEENQRKDRN